MTQVWTKRRLSPFSFCCLLSFGDERWEDMASQIALHPGLHNPFECYDLADFRSFDRDFCRHIESQFENGRILVIDNLKLAQMDFFLRHPGRWYPEWIPPVTGQEVESSLLEQHPLKVICDEDEEIREFQKAAKLFEQSWRDLTFSLFPDYRLESHWFSYRFNHMALGNLHLDVPSRTYPQHQLRFFINLDQDPRILAIGPSVFELAEMFWQEKNLGELCHLEVHEFIREFRKRILDETLFRKRELPRHYLTLDPGAAWISHSSLTSHGLVFGRKTACLELYIEPHSLLSPAKSFNAKIRALMKHGPQNDAHLEEFAKAFL